MRAIAPRIEGCREVTLAEHQLEYAPITVALIQYESGGDGVMTRWRLDDAERARIAAGEDIYLGLLTFGKPMQPISMCVGNPWGEAEAAAGGGS